MPRNLTYSANPANYVKGMAIAANVPSSSGGVVASYSVSSALPGGLALNTSTGVISGTPTAVTATAVYVITATNSAGSTTASVSITVSGSNNLCVSNAWTATVNGTQWCYNPAGSTITYNSRLNTFTAGSVYDTGTVIIEMIMSLSPIALPTTTTVFSTMTTAAFFNAIVSEANVSGGTPTAYDTFGGPNNQEQPGTVTITLDASKNEATGTFSFNPISPAGSTILVTGSFNALPFSVTTQ